MEAGWSKLWNCSSCSGEYRLGLHSMSVVEGFFCLVKKGTVGV
jgi:hypothetical protein